MFYKRFNVDLQVMGSYGVIFITRREWRKLSAQLFRHLNYSQRLNFFLAFLFWLIFRFLTTCSSHSNEILFTCEPRSCFGWFFCFTGFLDLNLVLLFCTFFFLYWSPFLYFFEIRLSGNCSLSLICLLLFR